MNVRGTTVALAVAGAAALGLVGCGGAAGGSPAPQGGSTGTVSSAGAGPAAPAPGHSVSSRPGGVTGKKAGSADDVITFPPGGAASVTAWYHGRGGAKFTSLTATLDKATRAKAQGGVRAFALTCGQITTAARAAQAAPPLPLAGVARTYSTALTQYVTTATRCQQDLASGDSKSLNAAVSEVEANSVMLNRAAAVLIAALAGG